MEPQLILLEPIYSTLQVDHIPGHRISIQLLEPDYRESHSEEHNKEALTCRKLQP